MVMKIEIMEGWTDYSGLNSGGCSLNMHWILSGVGNLALGISALEGGRSFQFSDSSIGVDHGIYMFEVPVTKVTIAWNFIWTVFGDDGLTPMLRLVDSTGATQCYLRVTNEGKLEIHGEGGLVKGTSVMNLTMNQLYRTCIRIDMTGANTADCGISINGDDDAGLTLTGVDLQDQSSVHMAGIRMDSGFGDINNESGHWECTDLIVGTGECVNWGPLEVVEGPPTVDIVSDWTPSTGTDNFATVDEDNANGDTDYNSTDVLANKDIFGFTDPEVPENLVALGVVSWHRKEDSATRKWRHVLRIDGTDYPFDDVFAAETYGRRLDATVTNPDTLAAWDPLDLAPLTYGYEYRGS